MFAYFLFSPAFLLIHGALGSHLWVTSREHKSHKQRLTQAKVALRRSGRQEGEEPIRTPGGGRRRSRGDTERREKMTRSCRVRRRWRRERLNKEGRVAYGGRDGRNM